jgi:hypothetical protein
MAHPLKRKIVSKFFSPNIALVIAIIAAPFKLACNSTYKSSKGSIASNTTWFNYIKGILGKLINIIAKNL